MDTSPTTYQPRREAQSDFVAIRGLRYHVNRWGDAAGADPARPPLLMLHGCFFLLAVLTSRSPQPPWTLPLGGGLAMWSFVCYSATATLPGPPQDAGSGTATTSSPEGESNKGE